MFISGSIGLFMAFPDQANNFRKVKSQLLLDEVLMLIETRLWKWLETEKTLSSELLGAHHDKMFEEAAPSVSTIMR